MKAKKQFTVKVEIVNNCESCTAMPCFLAGNFNSWSPNRHFIGLFPAVGEVLHIVLDNVDEGDLELKLTGGDWKSIQCDSNGQLLAPFEFYVDRDMDVSISVEAWRDQFPASTASSQVQLMDHAFFFPHLNQHRRVWVYLPAEYKTSNKRYPVIYMHDGQNLFDELTAVGRSGPIEWRVDETIDEAKAGAIVIAVAHPDSYADREKEYLLFPRIEGQEVKGADYLADIVKVLKPYVDREYRTLSGTAFTAMAGSSLAGLLSLYAGMLYPHVFGTLGVFSPSIWTGEAQLYAALANLDEQSKQLMNEQRYYFYVGGKEVRKKAGLQGDNMEHDMKNFTEQFRQEMLADIKIDIQPLGKHGALYWQKAFSRFYPWWVEA